MNVISKEVALEFCRLCDWAHYSWCMREYLARKNNEQTIALVNAANFSHWLSEITLEYVLLQVCKFHDPAVQQGSVNLTIDYIVRFGDWGSSTPHIKSLQKKLQELWPYLKSARNKMLAHYDPEALMTNEPLGGLDPFQ